MNKNILQQNYYQLFDLPQSFMLDMTALKSKMRTLQQEYHPDNFANDSELSTLALSISSYINHAYNTLLNPLTRAIYLLELAKITVDLVHDTKFTPEFLFKQIELRESIEEAESASDIDALEEIEQQLKDEADNLVVTINQYFAVQQYNEIIELIKQLSFYDKLLQVVDRTLSNL